MLDISNDIKPLSDFKRNSVDLISQLKQTGRPVVLTINGKAEVVVQDARSYQHLLDMIEQAEAVTGVRKGLAAMQRGEGVEADAVFERLRKKHKIPRKK
jgi:prevent-host-death family protein